MIEHCLTDLQRLRAFLSKIDDPQFSREIINLGGSSIGQHTRHILEFYDGLLQGYACGCINYDMRKRAMILETDTSAALATIVEICSNLSLLQDKSLLLQGDFSHEESEQNSAIQTSVFRELAYCLEHSIHHQALIKVGLIELELLSCIDSTFGVAPATIRHRKSCAQ
jgi:uncharacterized damage-inducible protein DinB